MRYPRRMGTLEPGDLTAAQVAELRRDLEALRTELRGALDDSGDSARPVDLEQPIGRVSRIDAIQQQKMAEAGRRNHETRLRLVSAAIGRIASDEYGVCAECEEPIGYGRLKASPEARLCLACQTSREPRR